MPATRSARQRTAAQRKPRSEDESEEVLIQDTQGMHALSRASIDPQLMETIEQEAEIKALRTKNAQDNERAQNLMDLGVISVLLLTGFQLLQYAENPRTPVFILSFAQVFLLPLSLTPQWLPLLRPVYQYHSLVLVAQLSIFVISLFILPRGETPLTLYVKWALPEMVSGAVEMQRRGEKDTEQKLRLLEDSKYEHKGP